MSDVLLLLPGLIIGVTVHEYSHGLAARLLGDRFAQSQGRLTLNPLAHLSLLGLAALFVLGFGWARPVPINPYNFRRPRRDMALVAIAGPLSNIIIASAMLPLLPVLHGVWLAMAIRVTYMNVILACVNLLPIPPLDGSRLLQLFLPRLNLGLPRWVSYGWIIVLIIAVRLNVLSGFLQAVVNLVNRVVASVLT